MLVNDFEKFYNKALRFLSYRPRSEKEIVDKLLSKKASENIVKEVIKKLKEYRFVDDLEFANAWVRSRIKTKPRAWRVIKSELKQKGISDEIIGQIYNSELAIDELKMAKELVKKKISKYKNLPRQEVYQKLGRFLASKGFNWDTIKGSIDEVFKKG